MLGHGTGLVVSAQHDHVLREVQLQTQGERVVRAKDSLFLKCVSWYLVSEDLHHLTYLEAEKEDADLERKDASVDVVAQE